jgi:tetratricopeptide (TPR) repeat protein
VRAGNPPNLATKLLIEQGLMAEDTGDAVTARTRYTRALELRRKSADPTEVAIALQRVCGAEELIGKLDDARAHCEEALELVRGALGDSHPIAAEAESNLAVAIAESGDLRGARRRWESALATLERGLGGDTPALAAVLLDLEVVSRDIGDPTAADRYLARALKLTANTATSPDNIDVQIRVANRLRSNGNSAEAIAMLEDLVGRAEATLGPHHRTTGHALEDLATAYYASGRYADARATFEKLVAAATAIYGARHPTTLASLGRYGQAMMMMNDAKSARPVFEQAMLALEATVPANSPFLAEAYTNLADCLTTLGQAALAVPPASKGLAIREQLADSPLQTAEARFVLAKAVWRARRDPTAVAMAHEARDEMRAIGPRATSLPVIERWLAGAR